MWVCKFYNIVKHLNAPKQSYTAWKLIIPKAFRDQNINCKKKIEGMSMTAPPPQKGLFLLKKNNIRGKPPYIIVLYLNWY